MLDVVALGELLIDFASIEVDGEGYPTLAAHPGGAPANFLAALSKFGRKTAMVGKVGNDAFGHLLKNTLNEIKVDTTNLIVDDSVFTTLAFVTNDETGNRSFSFARKPGADTQIKFEDIDLDKIKDCKVVHFGTLSLTDEPARSCTYEFIEWAKNNHKLISYDPNLRKPLWKDLDEAKKQILWGLTKCDVVKISDEEVEFLFGLGVEEGAEYILNTFGVKLVFVTCGPDGCYYKNAVAAGKVPSLSDIQVKDTTGAGDIFGGSAVYKLLETGKAPETLNDAELKEAVSYACTAAGLSTTQFGGISSVPAYEDVVARMAK